MTTFKHKENFPDDEVISLFNKRRGNDIFLETGNWKRLQQINEARPGVLDQRRFTTLTALHAAGWSWTYLDEPEGPRGPAPGDPPTKTAHHEAVHDVEPAPAVQAPAPVPLTSRRDLQTELVCGLDDYQNDAVELRFAQDKSAPPLLRIEYVGTPGNAAAWISMPTLDQERAAQIAALAPDRALVPPQQSTTTWAGPVSPAIAVWTADGSEHEASAHALTIVQQIAGLDDPLPLIVVAVPAPDETAARRLNESEQVVRMRANKKRSSPVLAYCLNCGHPLRDPQSAMIGYGPECCRRLGLAGRAHSRDVRQAVLEDRPVRLNAHTQSQWAAAVSTVWATP